jgi:hypothetical protein
MPWFRKAPRKKGLRKNRNLRWAVEIKDQGFDVSTLLPKQK